MPTTSHTVYIIDDSRYDLLIASELIRDHCESSQIECFSDAQVALGQLKSLTGTPANFPNFLFLDIRMPVMDGFAFLEAYAKLPRMLTQHCRLYMLSSSLDPYDIQKAKANPLVADFLEKPLEEPFLESLFRTRRPD